MHGFASFPELSLAEGSMQFFPLCFSTCPLLDNADMAEEFITSVPEQRSKLMKLLNKGLVTSYALESSHSTLWVTLPANSEEEALDLLASLPLTKYMNVSITELAFHFNAKVSQTALSLN